MNYKFVMVDAMTGRDVKQWIMPPPVIVGRCPTADITIDDPSISRRHCQFTLNVEDALVVRDMGSMNGVYIDEQKVDKAVVRPGVDVRIGGVTLRAEWTDEPSVAEDRPVEVVDLDATQPMRILRADDPRP